MYVLLDRDFSTNRMLLEVVGGLFVLLLLLFTAGTVVALSLVGSLFTLFLFIFVQYLMLFW